MPADAVFHPSRSRGLSRAIALLRKPAGIDRRKAVEPHHLTHSHHSNGLERRLQPAPAGREARGIAPPQLPSLRQRQGAPGSRAARNGCRLTPSSIPRAQGVSRELSLCSGNQPASTAERRSKPHHLILLHHSNGLERRLQPAPAGREARGIAPPHLPSLRQRQGAPGSRATRNGCRLTPSSIPRAQGVSRELSLRSGNQPASTAERRSKPHHLTHSHHSNGLERRLQPAPAGREARGIAPPHLPSLRQRQGAPGSRATRDGCRLTPSSIPRAQGVSAALSLCSGNQPASTAQRRSTPHHLMHSHHSNGWDRRPGKLPAISVPAGGRSQRFRGRLG